MHGKRYTQYRFLHSFFLFFLLLFTIPSFAAESEDESETGFILHHVQDAHQWHFATIGHTHITLPLPIILYSPGQGLDIFSSSNFYNEAHEPVAYKGYRLDEEHNHVVALDDSKVYDFSITKNVASLFLSILILLLIFTTVARRYESNPKAAPRGIQSFFEPIIVFVRDEIAIPSIGKHKYRRFMPYLLTLFFFIWFNNLLGLLPGAANLTGNIAVTLVLAVLTFIITNVNGNKEYWKHLAPPGVPWPILIIMIPVEILGLFTKPFSLMIRLFVSITAGHIVILSLIALPFLFNSFAIGAGSSLVIVFINLIELLVATIQAYIFTLFSAMYIGAAVAEHHHEEVEVDKNLI
ncbi:MAG: F0F1 ATP synthase subunit A [Tunicatimonas sp.]|uniref:F0F1 ATP synthase subunit A n=1 Tax=Tunicatimonas sp. TaxID=1940096 RepID=UPI003C722AFB